MRGYDTLNLSPSNLCTIICDWSCIVEWKCV